MAKKSKKKQPKKNDLQEPEDTNLPISDTEDECPEYLEEIKTDKAFGTIFKNIHLSTIITFALGIVFGIFFYIAKAFPSAFPGWSLVIIGFAAGLLIVFGASELIILGVQGIKDKLNWNPYLAGILSAIGAALAELVVVTILLFESHFETDADKAADLATTAIILILTTVIINIFFLGISMMYISRKKPFKLPRELTMYESNLVLGMRVFVFILFLVGLFYVLSDVVEEVILPTNFSRATEIVIGIALILVYGLFLFILVKRYGKKTSTPQTLITEFLPEKGEMDISETSIAQTSVLVTKRRLTKEERRTLEAAGCDVNEKHPKHSDHDALATLRRYPWLVIVFLFIVGAGGVIWGGELLAQGIETGLHVLEHDFSFDVPILAYAVIVGMISTSPELIVTMRGLLDSDKEIQKVGLINQVSAINQTFFLLFGIPFLISGIVGIGIPITINLTIVMGGIYIMSTAEKMMIMDDNHFDLLEGVVLTILAVVSLLALAFIG
ncbi:MAG: hypothetical protein FK733_01345 [Asgard group archaeon]|nr:hypothetical protein [Asgard group archaeon]